MSIAGGLISIHFQEAEVPGILSILKHIKAEDTRLQDCLTCILQRGRFIYLYLIGSYMVMDLKNIHCKPPLSLQKLVVLSIVPAVKRQ